MDLINVNILIIIVLPLILTFIGQHSIDINIIRIDGRKKIILCNILVYMWNRTANINYTTNWFIDTVVVPSVITTSKCPSCNMKIRSFKSNSTPKDAVISNTFYKIHNIVPFTRTLRTSGCIATMILITNGIATNKLEKGCMPEFLTNCGVQILGIGEISGKRPFLLCSRNIILHDFLKNRINVFNRILIVDLYDTIFQGDPFTENLNPSVLGISEETTTVLGSQVSALISILGPTLGKQIANHNCLNAGTLIGGFNVIFSFLRSFVTFYYSFSIEERKRHENICDIIDQVYVNILIYCNMTNLSFRLYKTNEEYITCWDIFSWKFSKRLGDFTVNNSVYPLVIHLFDRIDETSISIQHLCPQIFPQSDSYVREDNLPEKYKNWRRSLNRYPNNR